MSPKGLTLFRLLCTIEKNPVITQRELPRHLGISNGKALCLTAALIDKGLLKIGNFRRSDGKLVKGAYMLSPEGLRSCLPLTRSYLVRKEAEYQALQQELVVLRAEAWQPISQPEARQPEATTDHNGHTKL